MRADLAQLYFILTLHLFIVFVIMWGQCISESRKLVAYPIIVINNYDIHPRECMLVYTP